MPGVLRERGTALKTGRKGKLQREKVPEMSELGLADLVTMGNAIAGVSCVFLCLNYLANDRDENKAESYLNWAFFLLPAGLFCDIIDGWVARKRYSSPFGGDLDSLADLISFGVSPACLGFTLGLRGFWDSLILVVFVLCGLSRLARYNVAADIIVDGGGKVDFFEGAPIPSSLLIVGVLWAALCNEATGNGTFMGGRYETPMGHFHPFSLLYLTLGLMMVSTVRIPKISARW